MAKGKIQSITYTWDRIIVGFLNTSFNGLFTTALAAGGAGIQVEGAGSTGVAMATELTAGGGAASVEGASCPDTAPTTAIVTSSAGEGDGSAPSAYVGLASSASFWVVGVSTTLWRWGLGKEDKGLQNRVVISIHQNNSISL
jgi:hypothetical protein